MSSLINSKSIKDCRWIHLWPSRCGILTTSDVPAILIARWKSCWDWPLGRLGRLGLLHLHCSLGQIRFDIENEDKISASQIWRAGQAVSDECTGVDKKNRVYHELSTSSQWDPPQGSLFPVNVIPQENWRPGAGWQIHVYLVSGQRHNSYHKLWFSEYWFDMFYTAADVWCLHKIELVKLQVTVVTVEPPACDIVQRWM